jgi:DUF1680 family protein
MPRQTMTRREFVQSASATVAAATILPRRWHSSALDMALASPLEEFSYDKVQLNSEPHEKQLQQCISVLMDLNEDSLLKPMRQMGGQPAPGEDLGGWYNYDPNYDWHTFDAGFAPGATFGQWVSALARAYAITGSAEVRKKVLRLNRLYADSITDGFYEKNRFPAYCYDKLVCGLIDSYRWAGDRDALAILNRTTDTALPHMPGHAVEQGETWRPGTDESFTWDESYTVPENQFIAYQRGAGERYREIGVRYLHDSFFGPLATSENTLATRHAYSHVNALSSAMQAYLTLGSEKHLRAAKNGFDMLVAQSFVTGGWGPDERLRATDSREIAASLTDTHSSFETPCGAYAHFKLTRYLLRVTREPRYGDSMERVMYNTVLGAKPLQPDGRTFYYSDYNCEGKKVYSNHRWPCCSGTLPQVATDYRINTYFRDAKNVFVNLYIPSTVSWNQDGTEVRLAQKGSYPNDGSIEFEFSLSKPADLILNLRSPAWADGASISINGERWVNPVSPGIFASLRREWRQGDRVQLELPMRMRLEALDSANPNTVALLRGPLVLFAITKSPQKVTRQQLLNAKYVGADKWQVPAAGGPVTMLPFTAIEDEQYSTYLNVTG